MSKVDRRVTLGLANYAAPEATYDDDYHPAKVFELWRGTMPNIPTICAEMGIRELTLAQWIRDHPKFEEQYELGRVHGKKAWFSYGSKHMTNRSFQYKTFEQLMCHSFPELKEHAPVKIQNLRKAKTLHEKIDLMGKLMEDGKHTPEELALLCNAVSKLAEMSSYQDIYDQVAAVEKKNAIMLANKGAVIEGDVYKVEELKIESKKTDNT